MYRLTARPRYLVGNSRHICIRSTVMQPHNKMQCLACHILVVKRQIAGSCFVCILTEMFQLKDVYRQGNVEFYKDEVSWLHCLLLTLVAWSSGITSVFGRCAFAVLRSTCSRWVTTCVGKPSAMSTNQANSAFHPFVVDKWVVKLQLDVCCLSCGGAIWWTLTKERQAWCCLQVKLCDPCLSAFRVCVRTKMVLYKYTSFSFLLLLLLLLLVLMMMYYQSLNLLYMFPWKYWNFFS